MLIFAIIVGIKKQSSMNCPLCRKEILPPECYWETYEACSACIRKVVLETQKDEKQKTYFNI